MHLIIFMWGFTGILGKLIHLDAIPLVWHRLLIAVISLVIGLKLLKMPIQIKSKKQVFWACLVGLFVAIHWLTFYIAIQLSTASLGILCLSTATVHVSWLEPIVMKRKFSWLEFFFGVIVIYGIYFVSNDFSAQDYEALVYGLISALAAASFNVFNAKLGQTIPASSLTFYELTMGFLAITVLLLFQGKLNADLFEMRLSDFLWLLFLGVLCTSVAFLLTIEVIKRLGAFTVSLSINLEPVYTIILAIIILNEHEMLSNQFYIGSAIIILVVLAHGLIKNYLSKKID